MLELNFGSPGSLSVSAGGLAGAKLERDSSSLSISAAPRPYLPEPRRLVELAKIGGTSIEWVLTGEHWENGSEAQERLSPEILQTACTLREISDEERATVDEALGIIREAVRSLDDDQVEALPTYIAALSGTFRDHADDTLKLLESAWRIQHSVLKRVTEEAGRRMEHSPEFSGNGGGDRESASGSS